MTRERALEIITAYGGDSARWPADERAGVLAMAADADVAAALAEARDMDALLGDWARGDVAAAFDFAAISAGVQEKPAEHARPWPNRWFAGGAIAAAVAGLMVVLAPMGTGPAPMVATVSTDSPVQLATAKGSAAVSDAEAFANVFTPTVDEEELI